MALPKPVVKSYHGLLALCKGLDYTYLNDAGTLSLTATDSRQVWIGYCGDAVISYGRNGYVKVYTIDRVLTKDALETYLPDGFNVERVFSPGSRSSKYYLCSPDSKYEITRGYAGSNYFITPDNEVIKQGSREIHFT